MNTIAQDVSTLLFAPPEFPVEWQDPEDATHHWTRDREHTPDPITPMYLSVTSRIAPAGRRQTVELYEEAAVARDDRIINTYDYTRLVPFTGTPAEVEARARRNRQKVGAVARRLGEIWKSEWRPELEAHWDFWASFDLQAASMDELLAHLEESLVRGERIYEIHYLMGPPMWFALDEFETCYCDLFPGSTPLDAHRLLQGFDNKTLHIGRVLWRISRRARANPVVKRIITERPAGEVWRALEEISEGRELLEELEWFLQAYGRRSDLWDWGYPSWLEDPTPVINNLKNYVTQPDRNLEAELAAAAARREVAVAEARHKLRGYPRPVVERFEELLRAAQVALPLTEDHTYYIDFNGFGWLRQMILEFGRRFAGQDRLLQPDDVFYLKLEELREMAADPRFDRRYVALARRAEVEYWARYDEPPELGTRPDEPPYFYSPDARRMQRYIGGLVAEESPPPPVDGELRGQAGSPGRVRGTARLIPTLHEAHRLQPGDILVTRTTAPPWTPLFLTAAGVVTDAGGLLSHGAVVAREYGIPAVVGTRHATAAICDGQQIEVDGDAGVVRLLEV